MDVQAADVNGDGRDDLVGRSQGSWWVAVSSGSDFSNQLWTQWDDVDWQDALVIDFNADGLADVAGRNNGQWWVSLSNGSAFDDSKMWGMWSAAATWVDVAPGEFYHY